ncbi:hypothetical protein D7030_04960 [Flavobacteriaceae bacterium AU392]|nr:hypothetical protein D1817_11435 [Flavobacteriaceae bacterium]RKM86026.1 hypothetical protein D7030_04960 [Flavobacteriaceae bacterium AU392]
MTKKTIKKKKRKYKRTIKIIVGIIIFFTLPSVLFFGFVYFKYSEDLPQGIQGEAADALANKMLNALDYEAYKNTNYIEWTFKNKHHYKWEKSKNKCTVYWKDYKVDLNLKEYSKSKTYVHNFEVGGEQKTKLLEKAINYFNNDSFWLVAPYKVFDKGVERQLVTLENNNKALLVTYTSGGNTPGDSYLWHLGSDGKPISYQMWASIIPIDGLKATWNDWVTTESGAQLPTNHKFFFFNLDMGNVKGEN